jgi:hypothetical protein
MQFTPKLPICLKNACSGKQNLSGSQKSAGQTPILITPGKRYTTVKNPALGGV